MKLDTLIAILLIGAIAVVLVFTQQPSVLEDPAEAQTADENRGVMGLVHRARSSGQSRAVVDSHAGVPRNSTSAPHYSSRYPYARGSAAEMMDLPVAQQAPRAHKAPKAPGVPGVGGSQVLPRANKASKALKAVKAPTAAKAAKAAKAPKAPGFGR